MASTDPSAAGLLGPADGQNAAVSAVVQRMVSQLVEIIDPEGIVLFGSQLKGGASGTSDIDLLVVWETSLPPGLREAEVEPLLREHGVRVDVLLRTPAELADGVQRVHTFLHSVVRTGRLLHQKPGYKIPTPAPSRLQ